jgi:hypothetical protein
MKGQISIRNDSLPSVGVVSPILSCPHLGIPAAVPSSRPGPAQFHPHRRGQDNGEGGGKAMTKAKRKTMTMEMASGKAIARGQHNGEWAGR